VQLSDEQIHGDLDQINQILQQDPPLGSGDKLTDEVEKVLQNRRPSQLGEPFHDKQHYNAFVPEVWQ
jgi:hypothetical protein